MAHIDLGLDEREHPGIRGLLQYRPDTAKPLSELAEVLLRGPHPLSEGERELIAAYVSALNDCHFCTCVHAAHAEVRLDGAMPLVDVLRADLDSADVSDKLRALLRIAGAVQRGGLQVTGELVAAARDAGASDLEIHDTVLIAAAFCMYNRYVDGLGTYAPGPPEVYLARVRTLAAHSYVDG